MDTWNVEIDIDWIKRGTTLEVEGIRQRGHPRKTWWDGVGEDMKRLGLCLEDAQEQMEKSS